MAPRSEKYRTLGWPSFILIAGFLITCIASYLVSRDAVRDVIVEEALPLTGEQVYSAIQKELQGQGFTGATDAGIPYDALSRVIESYQSRFQRRIYLVDGTGTIALTGKSMAPLRGSLRDLPGLRDVAGDILQKSAAPIQTSYRQDRATVLVNSRFIPELGWHLVVEESEREAVAPVQHVFLLSLLIGAVATALALALIQKALSRLQRQARHSATSDALTGLINRPAFEFIFRQSMGEAHRSGQPLSIVLFGVDQFKRVNDTQGHPVGDRVLQKLAQIARREIRESDIVARWAGAQFLIQLRGCPIDQAMGIAEKLRKSIAAYDFGLHAPKMSLTVSLGVAEYQPPEPEAGFFARAEQALHLAKEKGRNRVEPEIPFATDEAA